MRWILRFCGTCNARERIIVAGRCIICREVPYDRPLPAART